MKFTVHIESYISIWFKCVTFLPLVPYFKASYLSFTIVIKLFIVLKNEKDCGDIATRIRFVQEFSRGLLMPRISDKYLFSTSQVREYRDKSLKSEERFKLGFFILCATAYAASASASAERKDYIFWRSGSRLMERSTCQFAGSIVVRMAKVLLMATILIGSQEVQKRLRHECILWKRKKDATANNDRNRSRGKRGNYMCQWIFYQANLLDYILGSIDS